MPETVLPADPSSSASGANVSPRGHGAHRTAIAQPSETRRAFTLGSLLFGLAALGVGASLWHGIEGLDTSVVAGATMLLGLAGACVLSGRPSESSSASLQAVGVVPRRHRRRQESRTWERALESR